MDFQVPFIFLITKYCARPGHERAIGDVVYAICDWRITTISWGAPRKELARSLGCGEAKEEKKEKKCEKSLTKSIGIVLGKTKAKIWLK